MAHRLFTQSDSPSAADFCALFAALDEATAPIAGRSQLRPFALLLHDNAGTVIGGLWGHTAYSWLAIEMLIVPEPLRYRGIGSGLVHVAEAIARDRGCVGMQVTTFEFQAPRFYQGLGFHVFGIQEDHPPGHTHLYLSKRLDGARAEQTVIAGSAIRPGNDDRQNED